MFDFSIININSIAKAFSESVKGFGWLFYCVPVLVGLIMPLILFGANDKAAGILVSFLTSFVPLFATILTFYLSWCYNKIRTRHNNERLALFRETSTNILMMIPLDVAALLCCVLSDNTWLQSCYLPYFDGAWRPVEIMSSFLCQFSWHQVLRYLFLIAFYGFTTEIIFIMLMVCKRAYVIIINEIVLISEETEQHKETIE